MVNIKHKRLESQIQRALSEIIGMELKNNDFGLVSVTDVELTRDLSFLKIFVHFLKAADKNQENYLELLEKKAPAIRVLLGRKVQMRKVPELIFAIDESFEKSAKITALLNQTKKTNE